jgi:hypothetical protein
MLIEARLALVCATLHDVMIPEKQVLHHALDVRVGCNNWMVLQLRVQGRANEPAQHMMVL